MPQLSGSTTPSTALAAMAASMADPPRASTCAPACDASVWLVATMPRSVIIIERACDRSWACKGAWNISNGSTGKRRMKGNHTQAESAAERLHR